MLPLQVTNDRFANPQSPLKPGMSVLEAFKLNIPTFIDLQMGSEKKQGLSLPRCEIKTPMSHTLKIHLSSALN